MSRRRSSAPMGGLLEEEEGGGRTLNDYRFPHHASHDASSITAMSVEAPSSIPEVEKRPVDALGHFLFVGLLVFILFSISSLYDVLKMESRRQLNSSALTYFFEALLAFLSGFFFHVLGHRIFIAAGYFIYVFAITIFKVIEPRYTETVPEVPASIVFGIISVTMNIPLGAFCMSHASPKQRVWFSGIYWFIKNISTGGIVLLLTTLNFGNNEHRLTLERNKTLFFTIPILSIIGFFVFPLSKSAHKLTRTDGIQTIQTPWAGLSEELFRCWTVIMSTPGLPWFILFFIQIFYMNILDDTIEKIVSHQNHDSDISPFVYCCAYILGGIIGILCLAFAVAPFEFFYLIYDIFRLCWNRIITFFKFIGYSYKLICKSHRNQTTSSSFSQRRRKKNPRHQLTYNSSNENSPFIIGKSENDPIYVGRAKKIIVALLGFCILVNLLILVCRFGLDLDKTKLDRLQHVYIFCMGLQDAVSFVFIIWTLGYFSGNDVTSAGFYMGFYFAAQHFGSGSGFVINELIRELYSETQIEFSTIRLVICWFLTMVSCLLVLRGLHIIKNDDSPVFDTSIVPRVRERKSTDSTRAPSKFDISSPKSSILTGTIDVQRMVLLPDETRPDGRIVPTDSHVTVTGSLALVRDGRPLRMAARINKNYAFSDPPGFLNSKHLLNSFFFLLPNLSQSNNNSNEE